MDAARRNKTSAPEAYEVITHGKTNSMRIKIEPVLLWPPSPTVVKLRAQMDVCTQKVFP